jgi:DNA-binding NtrC family response regulator
MPRQPRLLFGRSALIRKVLDDAECFARVGDPILILGEPGTGKTVLARHIHDLSGRPGEFVTESAGNISPGMASAWLQGHRKGAYTSAHADGMGLFEAANRGTFFLDELGSASAELQVILLHLVEGAVVRRVGDVRSRQIDVRVIAATNADLRAEVSRGAFRRDLFDRFGYMVLDMPPLAARRDEISPLAEMFLSEFAQDSSLSQAQRRRGPGTFASSERSAGPRPPVHSSGRPSISTICLLHSSPISATSEGSLIPRQRVYGSAFSPL